MTDAPRLSVVIPAREGTSELGPVLEALSAQAPATGTEVLVVGGSEAEAPAEWVRVIPCADRSVQGLRLRGIHESRADLVAIGEDHAVPAPDWCEAVIRAHSENPEAAAVVGSLVNATAKTATGRGNFMFFASPWEAPLTGLYQGRPPPCSTLSFKRVALSGVERPGEFEAAFSNRFLLEGSMVADGRIAVDHYQDHGLAWSLANAFHVARSSYGYARAWWTPAERRRFARSAFRDTFLRPVGEARAARRAGRGGRRELLIAAAIGSASVPGAVIGALRGPGRSPALAS